MVSCRFRWLGYVFGITTVIVSLVTHDHDSVVRSLVLVVRVPAAAFEHLGEVVPGLVELEVAVPPLETCLW